MAEKGVAGFTKPSEFSSDPPRDVLRQGARDLPATAVQAEVAAFVARRMHFSTFRGEAGILVDVHSVLRDELCSLQTPASQGWIE